MPLLEAKNLRLYYDDPAGIVKAVDNISFYVDRGEALGIVGESGCGKTSIALALMRLLPRNVHTYEGSIIFQGTDLMAFSDEKLRSEIRWKKISMVFQGAMNSLNPVLKIGIQVAEPLLVHAHLDMEKASSQAKHLLKMVGLPHETYDRYPHELSGGMKQRVMIAMALILQPELVILDEPTSALDVIVQAQITNLLKKLKKELNLSFIFITHDIALSSDICDRIAVMYAGELIEIGDADDLLKSGFHPYAEALIASIPRLHQSMKPRYIPGVPPNLRDLPHGCRFHPRCKYAFDTCKRKAPPSVEIHPGHIAKCWLRVNINE
jgi:peptide/nickel transport system ATP-binding protein